MRTIAENLANADSLPQTAGEEPYRRKVVSFKNVLDRATGASLVRADRVVQDKSRVPQALRSAAIPLPTPKAT